MKKEHTYISLVSYVEVQMLREAWEIIAKEIKKFIGDWVAEKVKAELIKQKGL